MKIGSLCTGYGGLDIAVEAFFNAETIWCAEYDKHASKLIEQRFNIPNYGDIKTMDWGSLEPIDILTAGYPCQPFSHAGNRKGTEDVRHIWPYIKKGISVLRPRIVVMENVKGHLSLGFDQVLADLTEIGYDVKWEIVRAAEVGAPHHRRRLFIIAYSKHSSWSYNGEMSQLGCGFTSRANMHMQEPPPELDQRKVNPKFIEYMMGLPAGWVTDSGIPVSQQYKMLGNGVVPQQALYALEMLAK
jgi:DNA (cytosine-5)-methyltransferase 1